MFPTMSFSSVTQSCLTLCDPVDCKTPCLPVHDQLPEFTQAHDHQVGDAIQPSHPLSSLSSHLQSFPALRSFPMSQFFTSGGQSIGVSVSPSVISVTQLCLTPCNPIDYSMPGLAIHHQLLQFTQTHAHESEMPSSHLVLCHPLLLPPSIFTSIMIFPNESVLHIRWLKY